MSAPVGAMSKMPSPLLQLWMSIFSVSWSAEIVVLAHLSLLFSVSVLYLRALFMYLTSANELFAEYQNSYTNIRYPPI